jgi:hypothetical protein
MGITVGMDIPTTGTKEQKTVKTIVFIFENSESAQVDIKNIASVRLGGIYQTLTIRDIFQFTHYRTDYCEIKFKNIETDKDTIEYSDTRLKEAKDKAGRLLRSRDIVRIGILYDDETSFSFSVPWSGKKLTNPKQKYRKVKSKYLHFEMSALSWNDTPWWKGIARN